MLCIKLVNYYDKYTEMHGQQNVKILRVSDSSSVNHQEFFTVHAAMVYVIQVCCVHSKNS